MNNAELDELDNTKDSLLFCMSQFLNMEGYKIIACGYTELRGYKVPCMYVQCKKGKVACLTTELGGKLLDEDAIKHGCTPVHYSKSNPGKMDF